LEEVIATSDDPGNWTGFTSFTNLAEKAKTLRLNNPEPLTLQFNSLTTFNWVSSKSKTYGNHYARLPLPQYVFPGLARRRRELAPPELVGIVQKERIEEYIQDDGIIIEDYDLKTHRVSFVSHPQRGFVGPPGQRMRGRCM